MKPGAKQEPAVQSDQTFAIAFGALVLAIFVFGVLTARDIRYMGSERGEMPPMAEEKGAATDDDEETPTAGTDSAQISIAAQTPGVEVSVERVSLSAAGWVVVHEIDGGHVLNALGARRLDAGAHEAVSVELLRATDPGREYAIILYADNGNKEFEVRGDLPMIDKDGNPLMKTFRTFGGSAQ